MIISDYFGIHNKTLEVESLTALMIETILQVLLSGIHVNKTLLSRIENVKERVFIKEIKKLKTINERNVVDK